MEGPFFAFDGKDFMMAETELMPPEGYITPIDEITKKSLPDCCANHREVYNQLIEWANIFPNCCDEHRKMAQLWTVNVANIKSRPDKLIKYISYTEFIIEKNIEKDDWFNAITEFFEAVMWSLGHPSIGYDRYIHYIEVILKKWDGIKEESKRKRLLESLKTQKKSPKNKGVDSSDINILWATYQKWLKIFPFELEAYFGNLNEVYEQSLPFINGEPIVNRYNKVAKAKLHSKQTLIAALTNLTNELITKYNSYTLYNSNKLTDAEKTHLQILLSERKLKNEEGYIVNENDEGRQYRKILKEWFEDEKHFLNQIIPYLGQINIIRKEDISQQRLKQIREHGFDELPLVKVLPQENRDKLYQKISNSSLPYCIAMFSYLGFIDKLSQNFFKTKESLYKEVSKWFKSDKEGRAIKGNINALNPKSNEDKTKYTSHLHMKEVENYYNSLK